MDTQVKAVVLMSGGIDSAACAYHLVEQGHAVEGLFVDYKHLAREYESRAAKAMARNLAIPLRVMSVNGIEFSNTGEIIGRNAFFLATALFATKGQIELLGIGIHSGSPYYDCSEQFIRGITKLVKEHTDGRVSIIVPFANWSKMDIYKYFLSVGLPIRQTYSCEMGTEPVCGICASCHDRRALEC